jgi:hypothetical protein
MTTASTLARISRLEAAVAALAGTAAVPVAVVLMELALGGPPDPWQAAALASAAPRCLWNCSRQSGKSACAAVLAVHQALVQPGSLILLLSPSLRQSGELFKKVQAVYRCVVPSATIEAESALRLELYGGSRIVSLPGGESTVRGYSKVALLIVDEAARTDDDLYWSIRPMLAVSQGRLVALSTPAGRRGWWYEAWASDEDWERVEVPASACPRISSAFLDEERRSLPSAWYRAEYECQFIQAADSLFPHDLIWECLDPTVEPWDPRA